MDLDRARADIEPPGDFLVGGPGAQQFEHLSLAPAEQGDGTARLDLPAAAFHMLAGLGEHVVQAAGETAHLERQAQVIERSRLDRRHDLLGPRLGRDHDDGEPHARFAKLPDQIPGHIGGAVVGRHDDTLAGRAVEQLAKLAIDLGMVAERKDDPSLLRTGAAVAAYDMQYRPVHAVTLPPAAARRIWRPRECGVISPEPTA